MGVGTTTAGFAWLYPLRFAGDGGNHRGLPLQEGAGTRPCRGFRGVPQLLDYHQEGGQGVDTRKPHDAAECCRGLGCPQVLYSPPMSGGLGG